MWEGRGGRGRGEGRREGERREGREGGGRCLCCVRVFVCSWSCVVFAFAFAAVSVSVSVSVSSGGRVRHGVTNKAPSAVARMPVRAAVMSLIPASLGWAGSSSPARQSR